MKWSPAVGAAAAPARLAQTLSQSRARGTLDMLRLTGLSGHELALGQLGSSLLLPLALSALTAPIVLLGIGGEGAFAIRSGASDGVQTALRVGGTDVEAPFDGGVVNIPDAYVAGTAVTFTVVPKDAYGNPQDYSLAPFDSFRAEATNAPAEFAIGGEFAAVEVDPPSAKDAAAGFVPAYSRVVAFTPTVSGAYEVDLIFPTAGRVGRRRFP